MARRLLDYEQRRQPMASRRHFTRRLALSFATASLIIGLSLFGGMLGYAYLEGMSWLDAFLNAAMILSGMGPVDQLKTNAGKFFAGCYAIYSGVIVLVASGIVVTPIAHRILHRFHVES
jgi:hypothetical protein